MEITETQRTSGAISDPGEAIISPDAAISIPPADGGLQAWLFLFGAWVVEAILWAFPLTYGVFLPYYQSQPQFKDSRYLSLVGTLSTGIAFLGGPMITPLMERWHGRRQWMIWAGWALCFSSLVAGSFATAAWHLIVTQGVLYGIGFLILYYALLGMLNEWFVKKRGFAYGVVFAAAGISGTGLAFLIKVVLSRAGFATTLRAYATAIVVLVGPVLPLLRGRLPCDGGSAPRDSRRRVLRTPLFWLLSVSNLFQGLAFYLPGVYLPSFAETLKLTPAQATASLCLLNSAQVMGQVALGWLSDRVSVFLLLTVSSIVSAALVCTLWLLADRLAYVLLFAVLFGLFAGGYTVLYTRFVSGVTSDARTGLWLYGVFAFERGVGNIIAGPISAALVRLADKKTMDASQAGYTPLILFVGVSFVISAVGGVGYFFRPRFP